MNRCPDLVVCLKRDLQCLRPEASLVLIYRPNVAGMKGRVDLAQPVNRTPDLWCGSTTHYHSILFAELAERWTELPQVSDESRSFFRVHTGYFSNIPKCIKAEFIASWACSQSSVVSSSKR
ncbi:hypothetical protein TNCV_4321421 [Trichonephila clavipes]|uniref:Uncharacterized protein n=1 Tax=Trichonephila clavipes TaxID=2585209 RepID=A0A8X6SDJ8_TRICX|nr:hypothetical protein TNCV_4321421 [Trichonephila clavipes]